MRISIGISNLRPDESLKAGLEVVDAAVVELGHLVEQLLVLGLEVFPDWSELLSGLGCGANKRTCHQRSLSALALHNIPSYNNLHKIQQMHVDYEKNNT